MQRKSNKTRYIYVLNTYINNDANNARIATYACKTRKAAYAERARVLQNIGSTDKELCNVERCEYTTDASTSEHVYVVQQYDRNYDEEWAALHAFDDVMKVEAFEESFDEEDRSNLKFERVKYYNI